MSEKTALIDKKENRYSFKAYMKSFLRNLHDGDWQEADIKEETIAPEKVSLIFKWNKKKYLWCPEHQRYELITKKNTTEAGCKVQRFFAVLKDAKERLKTFAEVASFMWRAEQKNAADFVEVSVHCVSVRTEKRFIWKRLSYEYVPVCSIKKMFNRFYMDGKKYECEPCRADEWDLAYYDLALNECPKAFNAAIEGIQGAVAEVYKVDTLLPEYDEFTFRDVWKFIRHPYDFHIALLERVIGEDFNRLFPRERQNNYDKLCYYLDVEPPKSMRKEYLKDPFTLILHFALVRVGFEDLNAIRVFQQQPILSQLRRREPFYDFRYDRLRYVFPCNEADLRFFVLWMKEQGKEEMVMARQMSELMKDSSSYPVAHPMGNLIYDFHGYFPILGEDTKQLIKRRGISHDAYEAILQDIREKDVVEKTINYKPHVLELNDNCSGFEFHVITNTLEMPKLGRAMSNCVATYHYKAVKGECIIVAMLLDGKYIGCIELRPVKGNDNKFSSLGVYQALGRFNKLLEGDVLHACREWVDKHKIEKKCSHLD